MEYNYNFKLKYIKNLDLFFFFIEKLIKKIEK